MPMKRSQLALAITFAAILAAALAAPALSRQWKARAEEKRWQPWFEDDFKGGLAQHAQLWDEVLRPLEKGGVAPRAWGSFTDKGFPHQAYRVRAWVRLAQPDLSAWVKVITASPVEYFDRADGIGTGLTRSRFAGSFARVDLQREQASLSTGQEDLNGKLLNVSSQPLTRSAGGGDFVLEWQSRGERLELQALNGHVESLARELFVGRTPELKLGIEGENVIFTRIELKTLKDPGALAQEQMADDFLVTARPQMAEPHYRELAQSAEKADERGRFILRQAKALALEAKRGDAEEVLKQLISQEPRSLYGGYARMDLIELEEKDGKSAAELSPALVDLYTQEPWHPLASAARMKQARWLAQDPAQLAAAQGLALDALRGSDPAAATQALDFLSSGPGALSSQDLLLKLQEMRHSRLGQSVAVAEAFSLRQAELQCALKDWTGLGATLSDALGLPSSTREKLYQMGEDALAALPKQDGAQLWQTLGLEGHAGAYLLMDYIRVRGLGHYRSPALQIGFPWPILAAADAVRRQVKVPDAPLPSAKERPFADMGQAPLPRSYGQSPQSLPNTQGEELCLNFKSGDYWGCGLSVQGNHEPLLSGGAMDVRGYKKVLVDVWAPRGTEFWFSLSESGVEDLNSDRFSGEAGADGEQYMFPSILGTGEWQSLALPLSDLAPAPNWGNPRGNLSVDLQAVQKIDLAIPGHNGTGRICIRKLRFGAD